MFFSLQNIAAGTSSYNSLISLMNKTQEYMFVTFSSSKYLNQGPGGPFFTYSLWNYSNNT